LDYQTISDELFDLGFELEGADEATVHQHMERLRGMAAQIPDEHWRTRALKRIDKLPVSIGPPPLGESPQYAEALQLVARARRFEGTPQERLDVIDRAVTRVAELARQAPSAESPAILRMNHLLKPMYDELRREPS
jgi:hypothetical protein